MTEKKKLTVRDINGNIITLVNPGVLHDEVVRARIDKFWETYKPGTIRDIGFNEQDYNKQHKLHEIGSTRHSEIRLAQLNANTKAGKKLRKFYKKKDMLSEENGVFKIVSYNEG